MAKIVDPTQAANYPVVLSDRLLGKEPNEVFTGIRYNHKPSAASDATRARLKPSTPGQTSNYDLAFTGSDGRTEYAFAGTRTIGDGQYVLYFDQKREVFVLDRLDSTFNMNITRTPNNSDPESLARRHPPLGASDATPARADKNAKSNANRSDSPVARKKEPASRKSEKKAATQPDKNVNLALPQDDRGGKSKSKTAPKPKPKPKRAAEDDEDDNNDDDDLLLVEYPGGEPKSQNRDFSPAFPSVRRFDDFMDQRESEADDADRESISDADTDFKLPSPVNNHGQAPDGEPGQRSSPEPEFMDVDPAQDHGQNGVGDAGSPSLEDDLEKDLEEAFEAAANSHNGSPADGGGDESEISEED